MAKYKKILSLLFALSALLVIVSHTQAEENHLVYLPLVLASSENNTSGFRITDVADNRDDFEGNQVPNFEKFEITFQIENSVAQNYQFPYDSSPPPGIDLNNPNYQGITVNALFTPDNWQTTYAQPAFYYQEFLAEQFGDHEWYYPSGNFSWKVRFAPNQTGTWQFKLTAEDASGQIETTPVNFIVVDSANPGFIRVSEKDPRYFEFENGDYFTGLGYNQNYDQIDWIDPVASNQKNFQMMSENGVELVRLWLSQWSIYGSAWNPWYSPDPDKHDRYIPVPGLATDETYLGNEVSMMLHADHSWFSPCMFIGAWKAKLAVLPHTNYRVRIRYKAYDLAGPRVPDQPYGFVAKTGDWLWGSEYCNNAETGEVVAATYAGQSWRTFPDPVDSSWMILEGSLNTESDHFLPNFYLALENVTAGRVFVDHVRIEEFKSTDQFGPNIVSKPLMAHHLYFEQRNSFAFDKLLEMAADYDIYLRPVILEKNEWISNHIGPDGTFSSETVENFYGEWRQESKERWLQESWWRYLQARWGYATNIHSWELLNEGDPYNSRHYALADEFGKFMKCEVFDISVADQDGALCDSNQPNAHMVSTSFWHSFPAGDFWANADYPNIDYADVHAYVSTGWLDDPLYEENASAYHVDYGRNVRERLDSQLSGKITQPIIRGEAGIDYLDQQSEQPALKNDANGVWLHNYLWASLDGNALIEEYWWTENLYHQPGPDGEPGLHEIFRYFADFLQGIPLNNGYYQDVNAVTSQPNLVVVGQKDTSHHRAHLWVKNSNHTWRNVVDGVPGITGLSGTVTLSGFTPNANFFVTWYEFTTQGQPTVRSSSVSAGSDGNIILSLPTEQKISDVGIKIAP
jgi:hypothetical protein